MKNFIAVGIPIAPPEGFKGLGTGALANPGDGISTFTKFLSSIIGLMTIIAIIWFIFILFIGAFGIMSAGGDKQAAESARKKITTGIIGLVVVITALFLVRFIADLLGLGNVLDLQTMFSQIQI